MKKKSHNIVLKKLPLLIFVLFAFTLNIAAQDYIDSATSLNERDDSSSDAMVSIDNNSDLELDIYDIAFVNQSNAYKLKDKPEAKDLKNLLLASTIATTIPKAKSGEILKNSTITNKKSQLRNLSTIGSYFHRTIVQLYNQLSFAIDPTVTVFSIQPSCINEVPQSDGYLQLSAVTDGDRYHFSTGSTFDDNGGGNTYANATDISSATYPLVFNTGLSNPSGSQDYTIRVFNGADACFTDVVVTINEQDCTIGCICEEYIYLNEPLASSILKWNVDPSMVGLSEILGPDGSGHWYPGTGASELPSPHGLATDLNGFLYIAETGANSRIRKFDCKGNLDPVSSTTINDAGSHTNIFSIDNTLYTNNTGQLAAFDLCTGDKIGQACLNDMNMFQWGISYNPTTALVYVSGQGFSQKAWVFTRNELENSIANGTCIDPLIGEGTTTTINIGDNFIPDGYANGMGIVGDNTGNIYIAMSKNNGDSEILKYDANGNYLGVSTNNTRIYAVQGLVWSEATDRLYVASYSDDINYDCIAVYDANTLDYLGIGAPNPNSATTNNTAKTLAILKECCPTNNNVTIDTILCAAAVNDTIFLQELINCSGTICEGLWQEGGSNTGLTYNSCNNSVTINSLAACGTFTLESDGTGNNVQCGAFKMEVKISVGSAPTASVFAIQPSCDNGVPQSDGYLQISEVTSAVRYNWSVGSSYTGDSDFADAIDISGATFPLQFNTGLSNPNGSQDYTVRVFSELLACGGNCFVDYTITMNEQDCTVNCDCEEVIYLNEVNDGGAVHKYSVNTDGTLNEIGNTWYPGIGGISEMSSPHGLGTDLNGYLYIAETSGGGIRKLDCDGNIFPSSDFEIGIGGFNISSIGNTLYTNGNFYKNDPINAYDLCTQSFLGSICLDQVSNSGSAPSWGFYIDSQTKRMYATDYTGGVWIFDESYVGDGVSNCVPQAFDISTGNPAVVGITTDENENIYIVTNNPSMVQKYSQTGILLATSAVDNDVNDGAGYGNAVGIVYSDISNKLYVSSESPTEDCLTMFDTTLTFIQAVVGPSSGTGNAKGVNINQECCPTNNNVTIDTTLCAAAINDVVFLQELINCDGTICEGLWQEGGSNTGLTYNSCNNSVTINSLTACGTFTLESDGTGSNAQCGAFKMEVNISVNVVTASVIAADQTICSGEAPAAFTVATPATGGTLTYQWQSSTMDCTTGFSDISEATSATYDPPAGLTDTTYYRVIVNATNAGCSTGLCADTSNCITVTVLPNDASIFAIAASCTNNVPNDDGYLQISSVTGATHYNYAIGSTYTGSTNIADATAIDTNALPLKFGTLANPSGSEDYTIRIFNNDNGCFRDYTVTLKEQDCTVGCNCEEYIYLNETSTHATLKFRINTDGSVTEILNQTTGGHWAEGLTISPHGLGSDVNGFLYIGNAEIDPVTDLPLSGVDKYTCDGSLVEEDFLPYALGDGMSGSAGLATNIYSAGNILYMNGWRRTGYNDAVVFAYDICTRELLGTYTVCDATESYRESWDFHIDEANNRIIINNYQSNGIAIGDLDTYLDGPCVPVVLGTTVGHRRGITLDNSGNIYVRNNNTLTKYDNTYALQYTVDLTVNGGANAWGVVYSETTGYLYLSGNDADCISVYDPADGSYVMQGYANPPNAAANKAIAIATECCPTNNNVTIDTTLCAAAVNDTLYLQELINCDGIICEGTWQEDGSNTGLTYDACNNSVIINSLTACGTFILESDGTGNSSQCGAFKMEVNISVNVVTASVIAADQTICSGEAPDAFTVTAPATGGTLTYQWQSSTMDCTTGFSNISGAMSATYDPPASLTDTIYYRVIVNAANTGCSTGLCADTSNCITVNVQYCDWGDLPDISATTNASDYQTTGANNGPVHVVIPGLSLGSTVDVEVGGQPSTDALGDGVDEDGITIFPTLDISQGSTIRLPLNYINTTGNTAHIEAWIDWNGDGDFEDAGEMVFDESDSGSSGYDRIEVTAPSTAVTGQFIGLRIRISDQDNMTPYGKINSGEIEDYLIGLDCVAQICLPVQIQITKQE